MKAHNLIISDELFELELNLTQRDFYLCVHNIHINLSYPCQCLL